MVGRIIFILNGFVLLTNEFQTNSSTTANYSAPNSSNHMTVPDVHQNYTSTNWFNKQSQTNNQQTEQTHSTTPIVHNSQSTNTQPTFSNRLNKNYTSFSTPKTLKFSLTTTVKKMSGNSSNQQQSTTLSYYSTNSLTTSLKHTSQQMWQPGMPGTVPDWINQLIGTPPPPLSPDKTRPTISCTPPENHPTPPPGFNIETGMGTGYECMTKFYNFFPCGTYDEFMCVCQRSCTEEENRKQEEQLKNNQSLPKFDNELSDGFRISVLSFVMLLGVIGNIVVIVTISHFMGKQTVTNMYICNLAVADLLVVTICVPFKIAELVNSFEWLAGDAMCRIVTWLYFFSFMASVFTLTAMSIERFLVICYPVSSHLISSMRRTKFIILFIWILSAVLASPAFYIFSVHRYGIHSSTCGVSQMNSAFGERIGFYIYMFLVIFFIPCSLMAFAYIKTCLTLYESIQKQRELKNTHMKYSKRKTSKSSSSGRYQVIRVLILVLVVFVVCWFPYLFTMFVIYAKKQRGLIAEYSYYERECSKWFNVLSLANSCLNPLLYGLLSRRYREGFIRCFKCDKRSLNKVNSSIRSISSSIGRGSLHTQTSSSYSRQNSVKSEPLPQSNLDTMPNLNDFNNNDDIVNVGVDKSDFTKEDSAVNFDVDKAVFMKEDSASSISGEDMVVYEKEESVGVENEGFQHENDDKQYPNNNIDHDQEDHGGSVLSNITSTFPETMYDKITNFPQIYEQQIILSGNESEA